jgi:hypothetical protein
MFPVGLVVVEISEKLVWRDVESHVICIFRLQAKGGDISM